MLQSTIHGILDLVYPRVCLGCKKKIRGKNHPASTVCASCWSMIKKNTPPFCHFCGRNLARNGYTKHVCPNCIKRQLHFDRAFSPCIYDGVIRELIHDFKYRGKEYLGEILAEPMIDFIKDFDFPLDIIDCIIPVPLCATRLREREFNQAQILAKYLAREFKKELNTRCLLRTRMAKPQVELAEEERLNNLNGCFQVRAKSDLRNKNILLVDDVLTTGATASEASLTLKRAGAGIVFVLTLAN